MTSLHTPLCDELGIDYPIFSVGFGVSAGPALVAAVSGAGGCGVLGAGEGVMPGHELRRRIAAVRRLTRRPFGVNFVIAPLEDPLASAEDRQRLCQRIADAVEQRVPLIVLFWGDAAPFVEDAHRRGVKVAVQVGSVGEAQAAAAAGVAAVIAQGTEAGGQLRGKASIWDLLPSVVEAVEPLPVLAAGGIGDGAGIARALHLGAQGVSLGTRFVASEEAWIHPPTSSASSRAAPRTPSSASCSPAAAGRSANERCATRHSPPGTAQVAQSQASGPAMEQRLARSGSLGASGPGRVTRSARSCPTSTATPTTPRCGPASASTSSTTSTPAAAIVHDLIQEAETALA